MEKRPHWAFVVRGMAQPPVIGELVIGKASVGLLVDHRNLPGGEQRAIEEDAEKVDLGTAIRDDDLES